LGNYIADAFAKRAECDVMLVGSGSIRVKKLGPAVTLKDFLACFPYDDTLTRFTVKGIHLEKIFSFIMRPENRTGEGECYQTNGKVRAVYSDKKRRLELLTIDGKPVLDNKKYTLCMQNYHFNNCQAYLNISEKELLSAGPSKVITTSAQQVLEEYFCNNPNSKSEVEGRLVYR
jgi:5'-nucleotidase